MSYAKYGSTIAEFVRRWRERNHLSQLEVAESIGVHRQYVSNIERGRHENPMSFCMTLMPALNQSEQMFLLDLLQEEASKKTEKRRDTIGRGKAVGQRNNRAPIRRDGQRRKADVGAPA